LSYQVQNVKEGSELGTQAQIPQVALFHC
jgi:hypothetical protein